MKYTGQMIDDFYENGNTAHDPRFMIMVNDLLRLGGRESLSSIVFIGNASDQLYLFQQINVWLSVGLRCGFAYSNRYLWTLLCKRWEVVQRIGENELVDALEI